MTDTAVLSTAEARQLTDRIKVAVEGTWLLIQEAYTSRTWAVLGYDTWDTYCAEEFGASRLRLPREERQEVVASLRESGLSTRAIASATGVNQATISRDLTSGDAFPRGNASPGEQKVIGRDGKSYTPAQTPPAPKPDLFAGEDWVQPNNSGLKRATTQPSAPAKAEPVMLTLRTHTGEEVPYPKPQGKATFNTSPGEGISWASWSWNPVTGCLHGCDYCYARELATSERLKTAYPVGFTPLFHEQRLDAPANTVIPEKHRDDPAWRRVFVCSMADLYGRWVPDEWIQRVHASMLATPEWEYLLLTKFPARYVGLDMPPGAWVGTSVDEQKRVRIAEKAFREIDGAAVKWLSLEPLLEPLEFTDLSMFDWVVIGAQTQTHQPTGSVPAFAPPFEWVARIVLQAREAGCKVHLKPNLINGRPGMQFPDEYPQPDLGQ
jgi:protein gp37